MTHSKHVPQDYGHPEVPFELVKPVDAEEVAEASQGDDVEPDNSNCVRDPLPDDRRRSETTDDDDEFRDVPASAESGSDPLFGDGKKD